MAHIANTKANWYSAICQDATSRGLHDSLDGLEISITMTSSGIVRYAQDDMSTRLRPSSYVDYFSHDWTQEAIQKSWKYIASNSNELDNAPRLGNASLRIWIKHMHKLKTIPPEALNW